MTASSLVEADSLPSHSAPSQVVHIPLGSQDLAVINQTMGETCGCRCVLHQLLTPYCAEGAEVHPDARGGGLL